MLRIIYFSRGLSGHDLRFLEAFRRHQVEVGFLSLHQLPQSSPVVADGVHVLGDLGVPASPSTGQLLAAIETLRRIVCNFSPDLVVAGPVHDCGFVTARAGLPCPWVTQSWAFDVLWENEVDKGAGNRACQVLQETPALFADCAAVVAHCKRLAGRSNMRYFIMPWGLEHTVSPVRKSRELLRMELGLVDRQVFLHTRSLEPVYAVGTLLSAFNQFHKRVPMACLLMASEGSQRQWVENQMALMDSTESIRLLGSVSHDRLMLLYQVADFYVSCAASDGTSVSLLEAMSAGLPALVNDRGGNTEWISAGQNGWVVPFGDISRLAGAMEEAAALGNAERLAMMRMSRELVAARADWSVNFPRYLEFLHKLARESGK